MASRPFGTITSELEAAIQNIDSAKKASDEAEQKASRARSELSEAQNKVVTLRAELEASLDERMGVQRSGGRIR